MPSINAPSIARRLLQEYGIRGDFVPFLAPDLVPVVLIDDLVERDQQDTLFQPPAWGNTNIAGAAGERGYAQLRNPAGSGMLVHVSGLLLAVDASNVIEISEYGTQLSAPAYGGWMDQGIPASPLAEICALSTVGALGTIRTSLRVLANTPEMFQVDLTLREGQGVITSAVATGQFIRANFFWSEVLATT